jgi:hypothetical protein
LSIERFKNEKEAEIRSRELRIPYTLNHTYAKKWGRIIRFSEVGR